MHMLRSASSRKGDTIYLKNFGPGPKWLSGLIRRVTGPVSYTVVTTEGQEHRRHVDHLRSRYEDKGASVPTAQPSSAVSALASNHSRQPEGSEVVIDTTPQETEADHSTDPTQASNNSTNNPESTDVEAEAVMVEASAPPPIPAEDQLPRRSDQVRRAPVHLKDYVTGV